MDRLRDAVALHRRAWLDRWHRLLLAAREAGFPLDPATAEVLPALLDATDAALERRFRVPVAGAASIAAEAQRAAAQCSLLRDFLLDAIGEGVPRLSAAEEKRAADAVAHAAAQVLVERALRREQQRNRRASVRLAALGHDLRNSATVAALALDLLRRTGKLPESRAARLLAAGVAALRDRLEDSFLDEALSAGGLRLSEVALAPILAETAAAETARAGRGIQVIVSDPATSLRVHADPRLVGPVVRGLFRAARQIARPGATVSVRASAARNKARVAVSFPGLRVDRLPDLPALVLARRAARAHGGSLSAHHSEKGGFELRLALPRVQRD